MLDSTKIGNSELKNKYEDIVKLIKSYKKAVVAFSGGIDSTLLTYLAHNILKENFIAITINSEFFSDFELGEVKNLQEKYGFNHKIINLGVLNNSKITANTPLRCKYCKEVVIKSILDEAKKADIENILDGSNLDDTGDYRPGFEAAKALGVKNPFMETGFTKNDIRNLAKIFELPNWNKPASACLASRVPYEIKLTQEILDTVEKSETCLREMGYSGFRVRHHGQIARIELNLNDIERFISQDREKTDKELKKLGYNYVCLDLQGYKMGSLNDLRIKDE